MFSLRGTTQKINKMKETSTLGHKPEIDFVCKSVFGGWSF